MVSELIFVFGDDDRILIFFFIYFSTGNAANGEQQLVVTMDLNGVQYEGVLFANPSTSNSPGTTTKTNPNSNHNSIDERETSRVARPLVSS